MPHDHPSVGNLFLAGLPAEALDRLHPHFNHCDFPLRKILFDMGDPVEHIYFYDQGMTSLLVRLENGALQEVGLTGREGLVGLSALFGAKTSPHMAMTQLPGRGIRIRQEIFSGEMRHSPALLERVLRYSQALSTQISQTAACNAHHNLPERLARWLLMAHDRNRGDELLLTQEFLSMMLGVRRSGVTVAASTLQRAGIIAYDRGRITLINRKRLENAACECYETAKLQYRELLGVDFG